MPDEKPTYELTLDRAQATILRDMVLRCSVTGPDARALADLHDQAKEACAILNVEWKGPA